MPAVAPARARTQVDLDDAAKSPAVAEVDIEDTPDYEIPLNVAAVALAEVHSAHCRADALRAFTWLVLAFLSALVEIASLLSVILALVAPRCFSQADCRHGTACINFFHHNLWFSSTCEDCWYMAQDETVAAPTSKLYSAYMVVKTPEERLGFGARLTKQ